VCSREEDDCDELRGECVHDGPGLHSCHCHPGYESTNDGVSCVDISECSSSPCQNDGTCSEGACTDAACVVEWSCACVSGWEGGKCEDDVDECALHPCTNGGACTESSQLFTSSDSDGSWVASS
jgi:hypothetical protein